MNYFSSIRNYCIDDSWLNKRMLFLSGPRQVGKTTLVKSHLPLNPKAYFNWDLREVRAKYRKDPSFFCKGPFIQGDWIYIDEIHKRHQWKNILKGIFDEYRDTYRFVVTGSALLETFKKSGDSLVGRYFNTHLFPVNLGDFRGKDFYFYFKAIDLIHLALEEPDKAIINDLLELGGFPEPFFRGSAHFWKRWSNQHCDLIISEDLRELSHLQDLDKIQMLLENLIPLVGNPVSNNAISKELEVAHTTVKNWLIQLQKVQLIFPVHPFSKKLKNFFKKETKWYFVDWRLANGARFENYVAATLHRACTLYKDRLGENFNLHFLRNHKGDEIDFLLTLDHQPYLLIEAKNGKPEVSPLCYEFARKFGVPCIITSKEPGLNRRVKNSENLPIFQLSFSRLATLLP